MENASEREILLFLNYVKRFPQGLYGEKFPDYRIVCRLGDQRNARRLIFFGKQE
jgi:hypothetical protein